MRRNTPTLSDEGARVTFAQEDTLRMSKTLLGILPTIGGQDDGAW
jgi:hypothetical protein